MIDIEVLKFIKAQREVDIYDIKKQFSISRTAALYRLAQLQHEGLVTSFNRGKKKIYMLVAGYKLEEYFSKQIKSLQENYDELFSNHSETKKKTSRKNMNLVLMNFLELLPESKKELEKYYNVTDYTDKQLYISKEEFIRRGKEADVIVNNYASNVDEPILKELPKLQYMCLGTHMTYYVDLNACSKHNVHVSNIDRNYKSIAITEFLLAQTFALLRKTIEASNQVKAGVAEFKYFVGEQLRGKKAVILGTDPGAPELTAALRNLGVEVSIYTTKKEENPAFWGLSQFATLEQIYNDTDLLYIPWTGNELVEDPGKLDKASLEKIKRPMYIISVYKHRSLDIMKVREFLYSGLIRGIALDYFPNIINGDTRESVIKNIMYLPNVIITPDISWYTRDSMRNLDRIIVDQLIAYAKGDDKYLLI